MLHRLACLYHNLPPLGILHRQAAVGSLGGDGKGNGDSLHLPSIQLPHQRHGGLAGLAVRLGAHAEHGGIHPVFQITVCKTGAREHILQHLHIVFLSAQTATAGIHRPRHILRPTQTALNLCAHYASLFQGGQAVHRRQILQGKMACTGCVRRKGQTARASTATPVATASTQKGTHIALSGHAHTQSAMDKDLHLDGAVLGNVAHLVQCQFPCQHHTGKAHIPQGFCTLQAMDAHLGGTMQGKLRGNLTSQCRHCQILNNHGICTTLCHNTNALGQRLQFLSVGGGIHRHIDFHVPGMAEAHRPAQFLLVKIACCAPCAELFQAQVYRICSAESRRFQGFCISGRRQNFQGFAHALRSFSRASSCCTCSSSRRVCSKSSRAFAASSM